MSKDLLKKVKYNLNKKSAFGDFKKIDEKVKKLKEKIDDLENEAGKLLEYLEKNEDKSKWKDPVFSKLEKVFSGLNEASSSSLGASMIMDGYAKKYK